MRVLVQRVSQASVVSDGVLSGQTGPGLLLFAGFEEDDSSKDVLYAVKKVLNLRIFDDSEGVMNLSVMISDGDIMVISQFTLHALTRKGNRPSYVKAARPGKAESLYNFFVDELQKGLGKKVATGVFGADMKVGLLNDGPVTIWIDTKVNLRKE